jgi:hypothetical protein
MIYLSGRVVLPDKELVVRISHFHDDWDEDRSVCRRIESIALPGLRLLEGFPLGSRWLAEVHPNLVGLTPPPAGDRGLETVEKDPWRLGGAGVGRVLGEFEWQELRDGGLVSEVGVAGMAVLRVGCF